MTTDSRTTAIEPPIDETPTAAISIRPIIAMMLCVFALGSAEYAVIGLLPDIARDLNSTVTATGWIVTVYAITVAVTGPLLAAYLARFSRKRAMTGLMAVFLVGNVISAAAPNVALILSGRVVASLALSAFAAFSIATVATMVPPERIAQAISWVAGGLILAMILGAPAGTLIVQQFGWRLTFVALAAIAAVGIGAVWIELPFDAPAETSPRVLDELRTIVRPQVAVALLFSALGQTGFFAAYTYFSPLLEGVTGFGGATIALLLLVFGVGGFIGNLAGGRLADRNLPPALVGLLGVLVIALALLSIAAPSKPATVVALIVLGAAGFAVVPAYRTRVLAAAGGSPSAIAANTSGINVGIALGSFIGGATLAQGWSERNLGWIDAIATGLGLLVALWSVRGELSVEKNAAEAHE